MYQIYTTERLPDDLEHVRVGCQTNLLSLTPERGFGVYCIQKRMQAFNIKHYGAFITRRTRYFAGIHLVSLSQRLTADLLPRSFRHIINTLLDYTRVMQPGSRGGSHSAVQF